MTRLKQEQGGGKRIKICSFIVTKSSSSKYHVVNLFNKDEVEVKKVKKGKVKKEEVVNENENGALHVFPMNRVTRIVKREF